MPPRSSLQDADGTTWATAGLRLGEYGMDLRRPSEPPALADLINARFLDERTLQRRDGFTGITVRDADVWPGGGTQVAPGSWLYGHGQVVTTSTAVAPNAHVPAAGRAGGAFQFGDQTVVWTGDRLLIPQPGGVPAAGASAFWLRTADLARGNTAAVPRGIPAHLPLAVDTPAPSVLAGADYLETVLTGTQRVTVSILANKITAVVQDRQGNTTSALDITGTATTPEQPALVVMGGLPVLFVLDAFAGRLYSRTWNGTEWTQESTVSAEVVNTYDVCALPGEDAHFLVVRAGSLMRFSAYAAGVAQFADLVMTPSATPTGALAISYSAIDQTIGVAYQITDNFLHFDAFNVLGVATFTTEIAGGGLTINGLSVVARPLSDSTSSTTEWVVHWGGTGTVSVSSTSTGNPTDPVTGLPLVTTVTRYNAGLHSRGFAVGEEVFAWLRGTNSDTTFLLCGATAPYVSGWGDRENGMALTGAYVWPPRPCADPLRADGTVVSVVREVNVGISSVGNVILQDADFVPALTTTTHGKSTYLSGSCVKNWDGRTLADAGFQDFPTVNGTPAQGTGGSLTTAGVYEWNVYAVRYNDLGERFESAAITSPQVTLTGGNDAVTLTINTMPGTSHSDVVFEVYRTQDQNSGGTVFHLEGTVANNLGAATVTFQSVMSDAVLATKAEDPHSTGVGNPFVLDRFAPLGCAILVSAADRLWGAGGQVPPGQVQFSLLHADGYAAGFDDLAGYYEVDNEGGGVTSLADVNDAMVIFEADRVYAVAGSGPDNFGNGAFGVPQLTLAAGATAHAPALTQAGLAYWGAQGPLLLTFGFQVQNIASAVRPLTEGLTPTGVQVDTSRMEVVWHCGTQAVLLNYMGDNPRWARWTTPDVVAVTAGPVVTSDALVLTEDPAGPGDGGVPFGFGWTTGNLRPESLLQGGAVVRQIGVLGRYEGAHQLRFRAYFDGSPLWSEESVWNPPDRTWLTTCADVSTLVPAQVDALANVDHSGEYSTHFRLRRQRCHYVSVEVSDVSATAPTCTPFEMSLEIGARPGLGRTPSATITGQGRT